MALFNKDPQQEPLFHKHGFNRNHYQYGAAGQSEEAGDEYEQYEEERTLIVGKPIMMPAVVQQEITDLIYGLFMYEHHYSHQHPHTNPKLPPEVRGLRHRNFYIYQLNQFRHWWKTSRLLVRISGGIVYCQTPTNFALMATWDVSQKKQAKMALKQVKGIGRGGPIVLFLEEMQPFTRSVRIVLAVARAWEARVDNRLYEVGLAEAMAFMGNRCSRYWLRQFSDWMTVHIAFPFSAAFVAPYLSQNSRPVMICMGFLRSLLPFAASFQGSRIGRQLTFNTYKYANYRWNSIQSIMRFHEHTGTYQDTNLDPSLLRIARRVAESIGHGKDPEVTRSNLTELGFRVFASGSGGLSVYRMLDQDKIILLYVTPYGPSILDELPYYILLERRSMFYVHRFGLSSDSTILDAATPREAKVKGFTYSGAFFQAQEWAALKERYDQELADYSNACKILGTHYLPANKRNPQEAKSASPPCDLQSLKTFIRGGRQTFRQHIDNMRWNQIQKEVKKMSKLVAKYQRQRKAPTRVILYLEGLDCAGKSSTGMLICQALEQCGYSVNTAQHNRPPTPEQRSKPWMDRGRFEFPEDLYEDPKDVPDYCSLVWDRGPAGDFVYGSFSDLPIEEKLKRYEEFRSYDLECREENVLFCKVFFVTDRDSIAATLGKRLAHKKIARDLHAWLDANSVEHFREGLQEIELHIDPTDFVAFNKYDQNIEKFAEFARNTDYVGHVGHQKYSSVGYNNPWLVVNTSRRHPARLNILKAFRSQLTRYATQPDSRVSAYDQLASFFNREVKDDIETRPVPNDIVERKEHGLSFRAVFQSMLLLLLAYLYARQTWNFDIKYIT